MPEHPENSISDHYSPGSLLEKIETALGKLGKTSGSVTIDDLAPVDEFHIGGRQASEGFLDQLGLTSDTHLLDIGCGLGGSARFATTRYGVSVTGIDLTPEFVETGNALCEWLGLTDRITLHKGSALEMPFEDAAFDGAYMMHVGMNIADKARLFKEVSRVLRPGAVFGLYDIMRVGVGDLAFPVPWASDPATSAVSTPSDYRDALQTAGFTIESERNRRDFALAFFEESRKHATAAGGPPALGLHIVTGETAREKIRNMIANVTEGRVAPIEIIGRKAP